jgi:hypothetical protein
MCKKLRYRDQLGALIALSSAESKKAKGRRNEQRVYRCPDCKGWHLSSSSLRVSL